DAEPRGTVLTGTTGKGQFGAVLNLGRGAPKPLAARDGRAEASAEGAGARVPKGAGRNKTRVARTRGFFSPLRRKRAKQGKGVFVVSAGSAQRSTHQVPGASFHAHVCPRGARWSRAAGPIEYPRGPRDARCRTRSPGVRRVARRARRSPADERRLL